MRRPQPLRWIARILDAARRFRADTRGTLIAEFAASLPMMLLLVMSGTEISRYVILHQKLDRATTTVGDLVAQEENITTAKVNAVFDAITPIIHPFVLASQGTVIVSSITLGSDGTTKRVAWQRKSTGGIAATSKVGTQGGTATLPAGMTIRTNETIIVAETFYRFDPIFAPSQFTNWVTDEIAYHRAFYRPRFGALTTID